MQTLPYLNTVNYKSNNQINYLARWNKQYISSSKFAR